ncbi:hypothetical protein HK102_006526 [Quaeritorhiza haematococci]|nr:hypothetical protein HK102_006526 [Quaeritorhiza haematococci]
MGPSGNMNEEITTIFVVGFPDDMQEREFQNMFTFSPGFEAATLKVPAPNEEDANGARKQIIGFAKFRTRIEAMEARDILSGRKVDAERGCILKAEMAKKNLHTKRGLSNDHSSHASCGYGYGMAGALNRQRFLAPSALGNGMVPSAAAAAAAAAQLSALQQQKDLAFADSYFLSSPPPIPRDLLNPPDYPGFDVYPTERDSPVTAFSDSSLSERDSISSAFSELSELRSNSNNTFGSRSGSASNFFDAPRLDRPFNELLDTATLSLLGRSQSASERGFNSALFSPIDPVMPTARFPSVDSPTKTSFGFGSGHPQINTSLNNAHNTPASMISPLSSASTVSSASQPLTPPTTPGSSPTTAHALGNLPAAAFMGPKGSFDQNPPCNTLYVGNLPPNTPVEELERLFNKVRGYKRLCYRNRPNGPMCFVEFDDVLCATQALHELYGTPLSTHTKGGIRLSFSKNPLGVRLPVTQQQQQQFGFGSLTSLPLSDSPSPTPSLTSASPASAPSNGPSSASTSSTTASASPFSLTFASTTNTTTSSSAFTNSTTTTTSNNNTQFSTSFFNLPPHTQSQSLFALEGQNRISIHGH